MVSWLFNNPLQRFFQLPAWPDFSTGSLRRDLKTPETEEQAAPQSKMVSPKICTITGGYVWCPAQRCRELGNIDAVQRNQRADVALESMCTMIQSALSLVNSSCRERKPMR